MAHARSWSRVAAGTVTGAVLLLGAGCSSSDGTVTDTAPASTPAASPTESATPTPTASEAVSATPSESPSASSAAPPASPTPSATPTPSASPTPATTGAQRGLRSARADVRRVAPQLQTYFDEREYPADRAQLLTTLADAGVTLAAGNSIGGYGLAGSGVDFVLCVQHDGGGWATYDTEAGAVDETGATGACPAD